MTLASLSAETRTFYSRRYPSRSTGYNGADAALSVFEALAAPATAADYEPPPAPQPPNLKGLPYESRFKADLTAIPSQDAASQEPAWESDRDDFLGHFGALLAGVRSGDAIGAQAAADALQSEVAAAGSALTTATLDAPGRMIEDLRALIAAARGGDVRAAHRAAHRLSVDLHTALVGVSSPAAGAPAPVESSATSVALDAAGAAYDTLLELAEASVDHAV